MIDDQKMCKQERSRGRGEEENIFLPNYPLPITHSPSPMKQWVLVMKQIYLNKLLPPFLGLHD